MALVAEDGSLVAGANSFVSRAEIIAYAGSRGVTLPDDETTDVLGIKAMDFFWTQCFRGQPVAGFTTPFPRTGLLDGDTELDFILTVPDGIKTAQLQLALDVHNGVDLAPSVNPDGALKASKVGPIEEEFFAPIPRTLDSRPPLLVAMAFLRPYLCQQGIGLIAMRA